MHLDPGGPNGSRMLGGGGEECEYQKNMVGPETAGSEKKRKEGRKTPVGNRSAGGSKYGLLTRSRGKRKRISFCHSITVQ